MRNRCGQLALRLIVVLISLTCAAPSGARECEQLTSKEWDEFIRYPMQNPLERATNTGSIAVMSELLRCESLRERAGIHGCLRNAAVFTENRSLVYGDGHSYQFRPTDSQYLSEFPAEQRALPPEFKHGLPGNWRELAEHNGWLTLEYRSRSLPNPPYFSFKRLLFVIRGTLYDRFIQFAIPESGLPERLIDMVAIEKAHALGTIAIPLPKPRIRFTQYWRDIAGGQPEQRHSLSSCYQCHMTGLNYLSPAPGSVGAQNLGRLRQINDLITSYGQVDWGGAIEPAAYGPAMGRRQGCIACHGGMDMTGGRGDFNANHLFPRSMHRIFHKLIQDLTMPPQNTFRPDYRLVQSLLDRAEDLNPEQVVELYQGDGVLGYLEKSVGVLWKIGKGFITERAGPAARSNQEILDYLYEQRKMTWSEHEDSGAALAKIETEMTATATQMYADYQIDLVNWLRGGRKECIDFLP